MMSIYLTYGSPRQTYDLRPFHRPRGLTALWQRVPPQRAELVSPTLGLPPWIGRTKGVTGVTYTNPLYLETQALY